MQLKSVVVVVIIAVFLSPLETTAPSTSPTTTTTTTVYPSSTTTTSGPSTTTQSQAQICLASNRTCEDCVKHAFCLWCETDSRKCIQYPPGQPLPTSVCDLSNARWGVCWVNYEILLIVMCVLAFVIILTIGICVYCCCCKARGRYIAKREQKETDRENREREEREVRNAERRADRQSKYDEIRRKYGLKKDDSNVQYNRFENEVC